MWKRLTICVGALIALVILVILFIDKEGYDKPVLLPRASYPAAPPGQSRDTLKQPVSTGLAHIFIVLEENESASSIINNSQAPYINKLAEEYSYAANYSAVSHPSLPNYLALTSGSTDGVTSDCNPPAAGCELSVNNLADEIEKSGRTWKEYAEGMPSSCYAANSGEYATKHNPFVYYSDIINNSSRCNSHVVPFAQLTNDLQSLATTPDFAFITPNLCDDMHDCSIATGDSWLSTNAQIILQSKAFTTQNSLLVVVWDEGSSTDNNVAAILAGSAVKDGYQSQATYSHYSLLHTIESKWSLPTMTSNDVRAPIMNEFFKN
ncbi:MAG TPA: alkaline phosphatase family protein [Candidatus Saccharimonadales bacterium]|nr:alkaline phosphatase family protein [Candidatus Saccharimonadales bacterium]